GWLIDVPIFLRRKANARAVRAAALVGTAERGRRRPSRRDELGNRQARGENFRLESGDVLLPDQRMVHSGNRVLPDQNLLRHERAEIAVDRTHVAVGVRYSPKSRHWNSVAKCPLCAISGLMHCSILYRYSITSSARARSVGGMLICSERAVCK